MIGQIVNRIVQRKRPDFFGPGFFAWRPFRKPIIGISLRYDDDLRRPDGILPQVPYGFRVYVIDGEVLLHTSGDFRNDSRWMHSYADANGDEIAVYSIRKGQAFKIREGDPLLLELTIPSPVELKEIHYPEWMLPGEVKSTAKRPATLLVLRSFGR